jgi:hypothetical protein
MKIRNVLAVSIALVSLASSSKVYAAPAGVNVPVHAIFAKAQTVKFSVRNDSKAAIELKVGEQVMTLAPGKKIELKLAIGATVLANASVGNYHAGDVLAQASKEMDDTVLALR